MYESKTRELLKKFKAGDSYRGYEPCVFSVKLIAEDPGRLTSVTKCLYPDAAKKCDTSAKCVEHNIRKLAEVVWRNGGREFFYGINGQLFEKRPSNTKFLEMLVNYVLNEETSQESCRRCRLLEEYREKTAELEEENKRLREEIRMLKERTADGMI